MFSYDRYLATGVRAVGQFETIETEDATSRVFVADAAGPGAAGVVVFHAWWGLNADIVAYAERLAEAGFAAFAPDLYRGPVAGTIEEAEELHGSFDEPKADAIALRTIGRLSERLGNRAHVGVVGFSMGGAWSMWSPGHRAEVRCSVVYYGSITGPSLTRTTVPVLGHFAETDPYESDDAVAAFERTLLDAGRDVVIHRYPGTGHWFAEPSRDAFKPEAAELAFDRTVAFLRRHLGDGQ